MFQCPKLTALTRLFVCMWANIEKTANGARLGTNTHSHLSSERSSAPAVATKYPEIRIGQKQFRKSQIVRVYNIHTHSGHSISKSKPCVCWDWNETPQLRMLCVCELLCANGDSGVIYYTRVRVLYVFTFERWHTPCTPISSSAELEEGNMENYFRDCLACRWGFSHLSPSTPFALALQTIFAIIFSCFFSAWLQAARAEQNRAEHSGNLYVCHHHRHCGLCSYIYICVCEHDQNRRGIIFFCLSACFGLRILGWVGICCAATRHCHRYTSKKKELKRTVGIVELGTNTIFAFKKQPVAIEKRQQQQQSYSMLGGREWAQIRESKQNIRQVLRSLAIVLCLPLLLSSFVHCVFTLHCILINMNVKNKNGIHFRSDETLPVPFRNASETIFAWIYFYESGSARQIEFWCGGNTIFIGSSHRVRTFM